MLFNSLPFIFLFLPFVLVIALPLRGKWLLAWIAVASSLFYALAGQPWFLIPMMITTVLDYFLALAIVSTAKKSSRRLLLGISLCGNLGLLIYFKYGVLIYKTARYGTSLFGMDLPPGFTILARVLLPAGISFYTFQTLSYMIDVYRGQAHAEKNFFKFFSFVSFFPHLVAGPLTRHNQLLPALEKISEEGIEPRWEAGLFLFAFGLCKKVLIADRIANLIDPLIYHASSMTCLAGWAAVIGYALQIYFDFSGYSDMAIGLGRLFGVELPQNFNSPYKALNPSDFWRRWHITLSLWLRDYLYFPLGGSRCSRPRQLANLIVTMFLGGLWHGAHVTFALWGLYHGLLLLLYHVTQPAWDRLHWVLQRSLTFVAVTIGWVFFRAEGVREAAAWLAALFGLHGIGGGEFLTSHWDLLLGLAVGLGIVQFFPNMSSDQRLGNLSPRRQVGLGIMTVAAMLLMSYSARFLYFQF